MTGQALDALGSPVQGATVEVRSYAYGSTYKVRTDDTGHYAMKVPPGSWIVYGYHDVQYDGRTYCLSLKPDNFKGFSAEEGAIRNLALAIQGPNVRDDGSPYGGKLDITARGYAPGQYTATFVLEPQGPLMDGSTGQPLTFKGLVNIGQYGTSSFLIRDIPLGKYSVRVTIAGADGIDRPAVVQNDNDSPYRRTNVIAFDGGFLTCAEEFWSNIDVLPSAE
ncbi:carboxypeptidase-like regulatory domain-containing protein [Deinococcus sonorensis]|uniref:Carboxypeptidase-like regulatory domain-containing protein n=2 Tax=Deinococcus sonorensis TaxID=309891 RepID=A0AAU7U513_9DEIO